MADAPEYSIDTASHGDLLFNIPSANVAKSHCDTHKSAPSETDSVPNLEPPVQPSRPAYEDTPVEPDPYLMLSYKVRQVWKLHAELRAVLAHIKLLAEIILRQVPMHGRSPYEQRRIAVIATQSPLPRDALGSPTSGGYDLSL